MLKAPPHNAEFEAAAIGSALIDNQALAHLLSHVEPDDFYVPGHRRIYAEMKALHIAGRPVDIVHLTAALKDTEDLPLAIDLASSLPTGAGIKSYCQTISELSARRTAISVLHQSLNDLFDLEVSDPIGKLQTAAVSLSKVHGGEAHDIGELVDDAYGRAWEAHENHRLGNQVKAAAMQTGIETLDDMLMIKRGDMVVVGARPSAGKTSVGLQIALHVANEKPVLFFSLEEPSAQIADRYLTAITGIPMRKFKEGRTTRDEMDRLADAQASAQFNRLVVNDTPGLRVSDMRSIALKLQTSRGIEWGAVMIDHMIKVKAEDGRAVGHQKLTQVSQDIKNMARLLRIPVIVLTQLRRPAQGDNEPTMSDLRESGSIEEDADSILLIHRPERDKSYSMAKFLLEKQRTGPCGTLELLFDAERMRFKPARGFGTL